MDTEEYEEQLGMFYDVITNEIEAIRSIVSKRRGPTSQDELTYRFSLLVGSTVINSRYRDLNIPDRCYRRRSDAERFQGFLKEKMGIYKRLMRKLNSHIYNF
jgi:hypothetical protein